MRKLITLTAVVCTLFAGGCVSVKWEKVPEPVWGTPTWPKEKPESSPAKKENPKDEKDVKYYLF